ncbi:hypothetical protein F443_05792 [Phytophthora nicotianae P1569]|uniref:Uncharacterized protein n=1 Tax=Phytophthora nicotianae P1569 TaxID=1317065 RepID=V9FGN4_PHYNI|nr:hypothetical protein F443_05792 [Phytophthora nicotianae P1569]
MRSTRGVNEQLKAPQSDDPGYLAIHESNSSSIPCCKFM